MKDSDELTPLEIVQRLAYIAPAKINEIAKPGPHCVLATAVGVKVLRMFDINAVPFPVEVTVCNQQWMDWAKADFAPDGSPEEQLRRGAHIITNKPDWNGQTLPSLNPPSGRGWDGHLVVRVVDLNLLVDLDLGSFRRPTKGIIVPDSVVAPLTPQLTVVGGYGDGTTMTHVSYKPLVAPYADDYQTSRDWSEDHRYEDVVFDLEMRIRTLVVE